MPIVLSRKGGVAGTATGGQALSIGVSTGGNTAGDTTVNSGSRFVIVGSNGITASQGTALGATTVTLVGDGAGVPLSVGLSTGGNTAGDTTVNSGSRFVLVASGNATASQATAVGASTITISVGTQTVQTQGVVSMGVSTGGNTSGDTTVNTGSRFVLAGGNNITLSQGTAAGATTITVSAPATSSLVGTNGVSLSTDGSTISIGLSGAGADGGTISMWPAYPGVSTSAGPINTAGAFTTAATRTSVAAYCFPMPVDRFLSANYIRLPQNISISSATTTAHWSYTLGQSLGIYTLTGSSLSLVSSFSNNQLISYASAANSTNASATWSMSYGSGAGLSANLSLSTNNAGATNFWSSLSALKLHPFATGAISMSAGQYFGLWGYSMSSVGANHASLVGLGINAWATVANLDIGRTVASTTNNYPLVGVVTVTQTNTALPVSFATADVGTAGNNNTLVNRIPYVFIVSQL